jgi:hypothetical protein
MKNSTTLLKQSLQIVFGNLKLFILIISVPAIFNVLAVIFEPAQDTAIISIYEWAIYISFALVSFIASILMTLAIMYAVDNQSISVGGAYSLAKSKFWIYIGMSILLGILVMIAFLLLIIPGIIVSVWLAFAGMALVFENKGIIESLKRSKALVSGKWFAVAWRLLVLIFVSILFSLVISALLLILSTFVNYQIVYSISTILNLLMTPIVIAYTYLLYRDLSAEAAPISEVPSYQ